MKIIVIKCKMNIALHWNQNADLINFKEYATIYTKNGLPDPVAFSMIQILL